MKNTLLTLFITIAFLQSTFSQCPSTITDIDGNVYSVVQIGNQCWMQENLKTSHYRNGTTIPTSYTNAQWQAIVNGAYSYFNDDSVSNSVYGKLYNWYAVVDADSLCPTGWHVPNETEWNAMLSNLDPALITNCPFTCTQSTVAGGFLKETGTAHWSSPNSGTTNSSGFSGFGGGYRAYDGIFHNLKTYGAWWSTTPYGAVSNYAWNRYLYNNSSIVFLNFDYKQVGASVRCISNNAATGLEPNWNENFYKILPNPFIDEISIVIHKQNMKHAIFIIRNVLGETIFIEQAINLNGGYTKTINLSFLSKGIYLLDVIIDGEHLVKKIMKD